MLIRDQDDHLVLCAPLHNLKHSDIQDFFGRCASSRPAVSRIIPGAVLFFYLIQFLMISTFTDDVLSNATIFSGTRPFRYSSALVRVLHAQSFFLPCMEPELSRRI